MMTRWTIILLLSMFMLAESVNAASRSCTIQDAYDAALRSYEGIRISEENFVQADSRVDQAWTYLYPRVTGYGSYTRYNDVLPPGGGPFVFQPKDQVQLSLVLTQPLYTGGRTMAGLRAARAMQDASASDLTATRQNVMLGVAEAYHAVIRAKKIVDVSRGSLERMERHKQMTDREARTRRTKANLSSLLRAKTLVDQARIGLTRAESGLRTAQQRLSLLTGLPDDVDLVEPQQVDAPRETVQELQAAALQHRQDYASARSGAQTAREMITVTEGAHYPQVYAEAGVRYQDSAPATALDATTYYGGLRMNIPLFEGGLQRAEVAEARSKLRQAEYGAVLLKRTIEHEVQEAYLNYQTAASVAETAHQQAEYARSNYATVEALFTEGLASSLSLIDAQQALLFADIELVNASTDRQVALLRLQARQGTLERDRTAARERTHEAP